MGLDYVSVAEAREQRGLRLVLTAGFPGPWGEAAKALFRLRGVPFAPVAQKAMKPNEELVAWTGVRNAPVAVYEDEPPRTGWLEILLLAERLGSGPSLLPDDPVERALALGFSCEICGPEGLGWTRRLEIMAMSTGADPNDPIRRDYGVRPEAAAQAPARTAAILRGLSEQLRRQRERGSEYLVGPRVSACDVHWACFSQMVDPFPPEVSPMRSGVRSVYENLSEEAKAALDPALIRHRDMILERHIGVPLVF